MRRTAPGFRRLRQFQTDPHFKDLILFHEYFDGDTGRGLGASHQTGWTGLVANLISQLAPTPSASAATCAPDHGENRLKAVSALIEGASRSAAVPRSTCVGLERWNAGTGPAGCAAVPDLPRGWDSGTVPDAQFRGARPVWARP